jgi:hypothetical protein
MASNSMKDEVLDQLLALLRDNLEKMAEHNDRIRHEPKQDRLEIEEPFSEAFHRLAMGQITTTEYLDLKVDQAMEKVRHLLSDDDFQHVREMVRDRIESDPVLARFAERLIIEAASRTYN